MIKKLLLALSGFTIMLLLGIHLSKSPVQKLVPADKAVPADRVEILDLLRQKKFDELDLLLKIYLEDYQAGKASDQILNHAYYAFRSADPALQPLLDRWVATRPKSSAARMARADTFLKLPRYRGERDR